MQADAEKIHALVKQSIEGVTKIGDGVTLDVVEQAMLEKRARLDLALKSDEWTKVFPGREILKRFVHTHAKGTGYEILRNLTLETMARQRIEPLGIKNVLQCILET